MWQCIAAVADKTFKIFLEVKSEQVRRPQLPSSSHCIHLLVCIYHTSILAYWIIDKGDKLNSDRYQTISRPWQVKWGGGLVTCQERLVTICLEDKLTCSGTFYVKWLWTGPCRAWKSRTANVQEGQGGLGWGRAGPWLGQVCPVGAGGVDWWVFGRGVGVSQGEAGWGRTWWVVQFSAGLNVSVPVGWQARWGRSLTPAGRLQLLLLTKTLTVLVITLKWSTLYSEVAGVWIAWRQHHRPSWAYWESPARVTGTERAQPGWLCKRQPSQGDCVRDSPARVTV